MATFRQCAGNGLPLAAVHCAKRLAPVPMARFQKIVSGMASERVTLPPPTPQSNFQSVTKNYRSVRHPIEDYMDAFNMCEVN